MKKTTKKGFTLVEMLVVIAIIAILVAVLIPTVLGASKKAKAATDAANLRSELAEFNIQMLTSSVNLEQPDADSKISNFTWDGTTTWIYETNCPKSKYNSSLTRMLIYKEDDDFVIYYAAADSNSDKKYTVDWFAYYAENGKESGNN